jgi:hypothetical protein
MAGKSKQVKLTGPVQWAKVFEHNRDMQGYDGDAHTWGGTYVLDMILDDANWKKLKDAGSAKKSKERKDTDIEAEGTKVSLSRKHEGPFVEASGPPKVLRTDGTAWDFEEDGYIGNGSICEVTVTVYETINPKTGKKGITGTRLDKVKVIENVTYERQEEPDEDDDDIPF